MDSFIKARNVKVEKNVRRGQSVAINWPLWNSDGMSIDKDIVEMLKERTGSEALPIIEGMNILDSILANKFAQISVLYGDTQKVVHYAKDIIDILGKEKSVTKPVVKENAIVNEDIAIIGIAGRYPNANTKEELYEVLRSGKDCITQMPVERWKDYKFSYNPEEVYNFGGFIQDIDKFDPLFFNISPSQAEMMDPQVRLFLEVAWEACEDAGFKIPRRDKRILKEKNVGVFAGVFWNHYELFAAEMTKDGYKTSLGVASAQVANAVSHYFNFNGPSMSVDTMCSSSLTALHLASESIKRGECSYALVGGVNVVTHPHKYIFLNDATMVSEDGRCRSFGENATGYVPGEGVGAILLTTVKEAEEKGYPIYGIVKATAINHTGKTSGLSVPDPNAEAEVIRCALEKENIDARSIRYIEAHGTGTALGDPIEITGLTKAFNANEKDGKFCAIGSVKSNFGHLEGAAGIVGITKVLLQLKHHEIFPSLHAEELNKYIPFDKTPFYVETELEKWAPLYIDNQEVPRRAGISAFGANGSNAHVIIEEYKGIKEAHTDKDTGLKIIPISAENKEVLIEYVKKFITYFEQEVIVSEEVVNDVKDSVVNCIVKVLQLEKDEVMQVDSLSELTTDYCQINMLKEQLIEEFDIDTKEGLSEINSIQELATEIAKQIKNTNVDIKDNSLRDVAYTLQVARESMASRVAFLCSSIQELKEQMKKFISGEDAKEIYSSEIKQNKNIEVSVAMASHNMDEIAALWVAGENIQWQELHGNNVNRRISLPTYPFKKEHYWITDIIPEKDNKEVNIQGMIHPLVQQNTSDIFEQRYTTVFTGEETFLKDHVVGGNKVLPGAAYLEMVHTAVDLSVKDVMNEEYMISLKDVVWMQPIIVTEPTTVNIAIHLLSKTELSFEVYGTTRLEDEVVYCEGKINLDKKVNPGQINLEDIKLQCTLGEVSTEACYQKLSDGDINYGPSHKVMKQIYLGENVILTKLQLPLHLVGDFKKYTLHPSLVDGAIHSSIGFSINDKEKAVKVPFALENVKVYDALEQIVWAYVTKEEDGRCNIVICNESGEIKVKLEKLSSREMKSMGGKKQVGQLICKPSWVEFIPKNMTQTAVSKKAIFIYGSKENEEVKTLVENNIKDSECTCYVVENNALNQSYSMHAVQLLDGIKTYFKNGISNKLLVQLVVVKDREEMGVYEGLLSLVKSAEAENPNIITQLIILEDNKNIIEAVEKASKNLNISKLMYKNNKYYKLQWNEVKNNDKNETLLWKQNGTYVITGGMGGLGYIFAKEIAHQIGEGNIILLGRSSLTPQKQEKLDQLKNEKVNVIYKSVDLIERQNLEKSIIEIKEAYGSINGILHCAGTLKDHLIGKKTEEEFLEVMAPKVTGIVNLDEVTKQMNLDFFAVFSSLASLNGNIGQSDYATANGFMDAYVQYRNSLVAQGERKGITCTFNWPLWQKVV
ncbi:type I polyketide synthase [Cellulosilyticum ruminicola]|uniref:type I polyketide synthase n=1 Tax=Cellulosilyticum ruminicola TaxID=425254 RepID=UPI0006CF68AD|nr:type I polyketide synthase [Cellulosilyticum ruminicola]